MVPTAARQYLKHVPRNRAERRYMLKHQGWYYEVYSLQEDHSKWFAFKVTKKDKKLIDSWKKHPTEEAANGPENVGSVDPAVLPAEANPAQ